MHIWNRAPPAGKLERSPDERRMTRVGVKASVRVQKRTEGVLERAQAKNVSARRNCEMEKTEPDQPNDESGWWLKKNVPILRHQSIQGDASF